MLDSLASDFLLLVEYVCLWFKEDLDDMAPLQGGLAIAVLPLFEGINIPLCVILAVLSL